MPKQRETCTRCSMKRQKCDRKTPCSRCVRKDEAHLCTTDWNGYNATVHRKYPKKYPRISSLSNTASSIGPSNDRATSLIGSSSTQSDVQSWTSKPFLIQGQTSLSNESHGTSYPTVSPSVDGATNDQAGVPASNNVDFLTYGRSEVADISNSSLLRTKEDYVRTRARIEQSLNQTRSNACLDEPASDGFSPAAQSMELCHLQSLLPSKEQVIQITEYHHRCMQYFIGGIYHGPSFKRALEEAYEGSHELDISKHNWQWSALLFSILSASMIGSPKAVSVSWGFSDADKARLSRQWGYAIISCLQLGNYASNHHIYSVQAIVNMHTSEHLVGSSKEWASYHATAFVIARGLGLHKIGPHSEDTMSPLDMTSTQKEAFLQREVGRRLWSILTAQDWFTSTSQGGYSIQKRHYTSILPHHIDDETLAPILDDNTPTFTGIGNYLHEISYLLSQHLDAMLDARSIAAKYDVVLKYDAIVRVCTVDKMPRFLRPSEPYNPAWPQWCMWARRFYQASTAHKVIMIHQSFLGKSLNDARYTYSRWACLTSSKTILRVMGQQYPEEPQWWVEQAFVVTAGLCLGLDLLHRSETSLEAEEAHDGIVKAIKLLEQWPTSSVATHGIRILISLLQEHMKKVNGAKPDSNTQDQSFIILSNIAPRTLAEASIESIIVPQTQTQPQTQPQPISPPMSHEGNEPWHSTDFDMELLDFDGLVGTGLGLDNLFFESMREFQA